MTCPSPAEGWLPIGHVRTPWADKFGVPRQPGLANLPATLELRGPWAVPEAVRGLEAATHLWLIFVFDRVPTGQWAPTVRPPRLGGNERVGLFASRSPFRPNPLGLSCVAFEGWKAASDGLDLQVRGSDLVDGTPLLDLKPLVPYADCPINACHTWASESPEPLTVVFEPKTETALHAHPDPTGLRQIIEETLTCDPRPAFHADAERAYHLPLADGWAARFRVEDSTARVTGIEAPV